MHDNEYMEVGPELVDTRAAFKQIIENQEADFKKALQEREATFNNLVAEKDQEIRRLKRELGKLRKQPAGDQGKQGKNGRDKTVRPFIRDNASSGRIA